MEREETRFTVILCPLISLIEDQINNINKQFPNMACKISKPLLNGKINPRPLMYMHYNDYQWGSEHAGYIEQLINQNQIARLVFDEFQTFMLWQDFTYFRQQLPLIRTGFFSLVFLSGSASSTMIDDCIDLFQLDTPKLFYQNSPRPHIKYIITSDSMIKLKQLNRNQEKIIIFLPSKKMIKDIYESEFLKDVSKNRLCEYHGSMSESERLLNQEKWLEESESIMLATTAFSLGIDYPFVRYVYVFGPAYELDSLIQMWGRCGRDGESGDCFYVNQNQKSIFHLDGDKQCIRVSIQEIEEGMNCALVNARLCSFCENHNRRQLTQSRQYVKRVKLESFLDCYPLLRREIKDTVFDYSKIRNNVEVTKKTKDLIFQIVGFIVTKFPKDGPVTCLICESKNATNTYHKIIDCTELKDRCKRCASTEHRNECTLEISFNGSHIHCGLPYENLSGFKFHNGNECQTNATDNIIPFLTYMYSTQIELISEYADRKFSNHRDFFEWLYKMEFGITNAMRLIYEILK